METSWSIHLQKLGGHITESNAVQFMEPRDEVRSATNGNVLAILDHLAVIRVNGEDSEVFLQGQFSNDIKQLTLTHAQLSSWCSPKGRVLTQLLVVRQQSAYLLILPRAVLDSTLKRLRMFVLRSRVTLEDASGSLICLGSAGTASSAHINQLYTNSPTPDYAVQISGDVCIVRIPGITTRYLLIAPPDTFIAQWSKLSNAQVITGNTPWQWLDVQAGLPTVLPGVVDEFVPQMLNLELLGAVNFKKGCYPGQEIVARTHYLGKVKRRLYKAHINQTNTLPIGQDIYHSGENEQSIGKIVSAQPAPHGGMDVLAVIQREAAESGKLQIGPSLEQQLQLQPLPYSLDLDTP